MRDMTPWEHEYGYAGSHCCAQGERIATVRRMMLDARRADLVGEERRLFALLADLRCDHRCDIRPAADMTDGPRTR